MNTEQLPEQMHPPPRPPEIWGGLECTINRVSDNYFSQLDRNGHAERPDDIARFASLGIRAIRYPALWELTAPEGIDKADWTWLDERLPLLQKHGVTPIAGLVHHGSGPRHTSLVDPAFPEQLAAFARAVAQRYPWLDYYTPVNEPLTTARFSGLYGVWYPHGRDERTFMQALLNQCRAVVLSMREIRRFNPHAQLVQTDDLGKCYGTPEMAWLAGFYNERRWLSWDLLCGRVGPDHMLWDYLMESGIAPSEFLWFRDNPCPPDIVGVNYYITSERWLDHRTERFPERYIGGGGGSGHGGFADIETARALATPTPGIGPLLQEAWERYRLPLAVTEAHIDTTREDQMRWLLEIWEAANEAQANGVDMRAVTIWALLGSYDWNCLLTECKGYYEPGPFDVRSALPRPTAVAALMRELADGGAPSHPVLRGHGWWRRPGRFFCQPVSTPSVVTSISADGHGLLDSAEQPILITGATGTLGSAFARICAQRNLSCRVLSRHEMDIADPESVERAIGHHRPWAIINACGYVRVDDAENDAERCFRENASGPAVLARACARDGIHLLSFSSDLVFDGRHQFPYVETDPVAPLNVYGKSKAAAERAMLDANPGSLVVRTSAFFGPWDRYNFITLALDSLARGVPFMAAHDIVVSPTYVPDLVHVCLDLLIDRESGIWHLTNGEPVSWAGLALKAAGMAGIDAGGLQTCPGDALGYAAPRPLFSALGSMRAILLPTLDDALSRYLQERRNEAESAQAKRAHAGASGPH